MSSVAHAPVKEPMYINGVMSKAWVRFFEDLYTGSQGTALDALVASQGGDIETVLNGLNWPIGSIFISVVATNPATLLGFGTWVAFGSGKTLIGIDSSDTDFDTAEETGGAKTHKHTVDVGATTSGAPSAVTALLGTGAAGAATPDHTHSVDPASVDSSTVSNVAPYIVCYFWKRTA